MWVININWNECIINKANKLFKLKIVDAIWERIKIMNTQYFILKKTFK